MTTSPHTEPPIGVLGATGQQGGAVVDALLDAGRPVRAIVRDPDSSRAAALADRGVELRVGDQAEPESLRGPLTGIAALFVMTTFADADGPAGEVTRGIAVAQAAADAGVPRVVYSSVGGAERSTGIPHFDSKYAIEQRLRELVPTRVVRPAFFMENLDVQLADPGQDEFVLRFPMPGDVPLQMVAVRDIGTVAAAALIDPAVLGTDALEIAGDELDPDQIADRIGRHLGRPGRFEQLPLDALGDDEDLQAMFRWFAELPAYQADLARTRAVAPDALDLDGWLRRRGTIGDR